MSIPAFQATIQFAVVVRTAGLTRSSTSTKTVKIQGEGTRTRRVSNKISLEVRALRTLTSLPSPKAARQPSTFKDIDKLDLLQRNITTTTDLESFVLRNQFLSQHFSCSPTLLALQNEGTSPAAESTL
jgi:hypothetical protein